MVNDLDVGEEEVAIQDRELNLEKIEKRVGNHLSRSPGSHASTFTWITCITWITWITCVHLARCGSTR